MEADSAPAPNQGPTHRVKRHKSKRLSKPKSTISMSTDDDTVRAAEVTGAADSDDEFQEFFDADLSKSVERYLGSDDGSYFDAIHVDTEQVESSDDDVERNATDATAGAVLTDRPNDHATADGPPGRGDCELPDDGLDENLPLSARAADNGNFDDDLMDALAAAPAEQPSDAASLDNARSLRVPDDHDALLDDDPDILNAPVDTTFGVRDVFHDSDAGSKDASAAPASEAVAGIDQQANSAVPDSFLSSSEDFVEVESIPESVRDDGSFTCVSREEVVGGDSKQDLPSPDDGGGATSSDAATSPLVETMVESVSNTTEKEASEVDGTEHGDDTAVQLNDATHVVEKAMDEMPPSTDMTTRETNSNEAELNVAPPPSEDGTAFADATSEVQNVGTAALATDMLSAPPAGDGAADLSARRDDAFDGDGSDTGSSIGLDEPPATSSADGIAARLNQQSDTEAKAVADVADPSADMLFALDEPPVLPPSDACTCLPPAPLSAIERDIPVEHDVIPQSSPDKSNADGTVVVDDGSLFSPPLDADVHPFPTQTSVRKASTNPFDPPGMFADELPLAPCPGEAATALETRQTSPAQSTAPPMRQGQDGASADDGGPATTTPGLVGYAAAESPDPLLVVVFNPSDVHDDDSESDEDVAMPAPLGLGKSGRAADLSDEDDLEVNAELAQTIRAPSSAVVGMVAKSNPLADAMSLAIASTTQASSMDRFHSPAASRGESPTQQDSGADHSSFGIAYQKMPRKPTSTSYTIGDTTDMVLSVHSAKDTAHSDEFDDVDFDAVPAGAPVVELDKLHKSRLAKDAEREAAVLAQLQEATKQERLALLREQHAATVGGDAMAVVAPAAGDKAALAELHDMYKRGLGDQEVAALEASTGSVDASTLVPTNVHAPITQTIAEEDDEDDDDGGNGTAHAERNKPTGEAVSADSEAAAAWETVEKFQHEKAARTKNGKSESFRWIRFQEAQVHFREADYVRAHQDAIVVEDEHAASTGCLACVFRPAALQFPSALQQRELVFCMAMCQLDHNEPVHYRILQTIYQKVTNTRGECPLSGGHWEIIGFQGNDPATDLRGGGMLSLVQLLYLVDTHPDVVGELFAASRHEQYHFPLACVMINFTVHILSTLRQGRLTTLCNKEKDVMTAMNKLYAAMGVRLVAECKAKQGVVEFPAILKDVVHEAQSMPMRVVAEAESVLALSRGRDIGDVADQDFTDLRDK
ncbi:hypothetical protein H310_13759 [Aphanomyces invadans]|uniref:ELMO domain-containing protein n=1 Tax=Aphanomyces invadans TaxID=157072 RepID=A0A024TCA2_9STRA|nr:hypothetical protein H310_13759 [Aphanomyces invadans]ETV91683.1 hypothetical protein H310_13759 [Aphanomyces invadans]|eukprot:XP_008879609.1 hypothetical protein H310_13759 [Aphanomyces invadans]